jgi:hypothetical protein
MKQSCEKGDAHHAEKTLSAMLESQPCILTTTPFDGQAI